MKGFITGLFVGIIVGGAIGWYAADRSDGAEAPGGTVATSGASSELQDGITVSRLSGRRNEGSGQAQKQFEHEERGFSLTVPAELQIRRFDEGGGAETVVFQKSGEEHGFQIFITPYENDQITQERLEKDLSSGVIEERQAVQVGANKNIRAAAFLSENAVMGETREVWFTRDGYLYEFTTYRDLDTWLAGIMGTLSFSSS